MRDVHRNITIQSRHDVIISQPHMLVLVDINVGTILVKKSISHIPIYKHSQYSVTSYMILNGDIHNKTF